MVVGVARGRGVEGFFGLCQMCIVDCVEGGREVGRRVGFTCGRDNACTYRLLLFFFFFFL